VGRLFALLQTFKAPLAPGSSVPPGADAREGLDLDRSTLCDWVGQAVWLLPPIVEAIRRHVFAAEKIRGDDTTVPVLLPGLGRTKTWRLAASCASVSRCHPKAAPFV
jgi:Transposase IS66 family